MDSLSSNETTAEAFHPHNTFGAADYAVFAGMLSISALIGMYYAFAGDKQSTTSEFLMGNRSMGVFPVALSLLASFLSAISLLGIPVEVYTFGTLYWAQIFVYPGVMFVTSYFFIPVFYTLGLTSSYEYLERRFSKAVRTLGSALFIFQMVFYMAIVLYAPSLALSQVTGLHVWLSVLSIGIVCTFYTSVGGMKAVIWTDVFQTIMMFGSMLAVVFKGSHDVGGVSNVWEKASKYERIELFNFDPNPLTRHTFWSVMIGSFINWSCVYGVNQAMVQRYLSIPTLEKAKRTVWIVLPMVVLLISILCAAGLIVFTKYYDCDPVATHKISASDQLFPLFVMDTLGFLPGVPGLFVAGIFSGALSTVSSGVNSLAATTLEDFVKGYFSPNITEKRATLYTKLLAVFYGTLSILLVAVAQQMGNVLQAALAIFGLLGSPIFGLFILGMFLPSVNSKGALWGTLLGISSSLYVGIGAMYYKPYNPTKRMLVENCPILPNGSLFHNQTALDAIAERNLLKNDDIFVLFRISYMYYGVVGAGITIVAGILISCCTGNQKLEDQDPCLYTPIVKSWIMRKQADRVAHSMRNMNGKELNNINNNSNNNTNITPSNMQIILSSKNSSPINFEGIINIGFVPEKESNGYANHLKEMHDRTVTPM